MKILVPGEPNDPYATTDITLILALMSLGHRPAEITAENGIVQYIFENSDVKTDVHDLLSNSDKQVSIRMVWAANQVWAMNLNKARG